MLCYIGIQPINNIMIVSSAQQRDPAIHTHVCNLPQIPLPSRLPHDIEPSSLCYTVGPCWLSILNVVVHIGRSQTPTLSLPLTFPAVTINSFLKSVSLFLFQSLRYLNFALPSYFVLSVYPAFCMVLPLPLLSTVFPTANRKVSFFLFFQRLPSTFNMPVALNLK